MKAPFVIDNFLSVVRCRIYPVDHIRDGLIDPESYEGYYQSLEEVEGKEAPDDKAHLRCDVRVYRVAHSYDGFR